MESSKFRSDSTLLFVMCMAALARNCFFLTDVHSLYDTNWAGHFCNFMRVFCNKKAYPDRSVIRNLVFDLLRGLIRPITYAYLFNEEINQASLIEMGISTAILSVICTLFVPKSLFAKFSVIWGYLNIEFLLMFTDGFIWAMNKVETIYQG